MFIERIKENFTTEDPIFTKEILDLFPEYSERHIFTLIHKAISNNEIMKFSRGVYILPTHSIIGTVMSASAEDVAMKRYVKNSGEVFGLFSGIHLLNSFSITTQVPATIHIVTNNESSRKRLIRINGMRFIPHKSRTQITKNNFAAYTVLQLFTDMDETDKFDNHSGWRLRDYVKKHNITKKQILSLVDYFPPRGANSLLKSIMFKELP